MPEVIQIYRYIYAALIVVCIIVCLLILARKSAENDADPVLTVPVRLIKKKQYYFHAPGQRRGHSTFHLFFLTENEELLDFTMPTKFDWDIYNEGDLGNLTYQGTRFLKFERTHINPPT